MLWDEPSGDYGTEPVDTKSLVYGGGFTSENRRLTQEGATTCWCCHVRETRRS